MTTYTIIDGSDITSGLDLIEAADTLLSHDGFKHELRQDEGGGWSLWVSQYSRNSTLGGRPLVKSVIFTLETDEELATRDIAEKVIASGHWERGELHCMTDEAHAENELALDNFDNLKALGLVQDPGTEWDANTCSFRPVADIGKL